MGRQAKFRVLGGISGVHFGGRTVLYQRNEERALGYNVGYSWRKEMEDSRQKISSHVQKININLIKGSRTLRDKTGPKRRSQSLSIFWKNLRSISSWGHDCRRGRCWRVRRGLARRYWPKPAPERREYPFFTSRAPNLWRCTWEWAPVESGTSSSRQRDSRPPLSSLMR